jgi:hypothetical protein
MSQLHTDRMVAAAYERRNAAYAELERRRGKETTDDDTPIGAGDATAARADSVNGKGS